MFKSILMAVQMTPAWVSSRLNIRNERGATAVEYGLMVALIAAVIIGAVVFLGQQAKTAFDCTATSVQAKANSC